MACYRCADDGVWSPSDKVPKRVETVRRIPISESHGVKGEGLRSYGEINRKSVSVVTGNEPTGAKRF